MEQNDMQRQSFKIISFAGNAYSLFLEAIELARNGEFEKAMIQLKEGEVSLTNAHQTQTDLIFKEANGDAINCSVIMVHAQDHLMNAMLLSKLSREIIMMYEKIKER